MVTSIERDGERWRLRCGSAVAEVVPARGAIVSRFAVGSDEVLFLDEATLIDASKNVRGGVPVLFPFAGKPPAGSTLPQHGFARRMAWSAEAVGEEVVCTLHDDATTRAAWPFEFELVQRVGLSESALSLSWTFENRSAAPMPLHFGLHPYFRVPVASKSRVHVSGTVGEAYDNKAGVTRVVESVDFGQGEVDLHFSSRTPGSKLERGDGTSLELSWSRQFDTLVVWTLPEAGFVCVEPWTARGQQPATQFVAPRSRVTLALGINAR
ncbi:MAG: aldose epimerase [Archangium sp.]